MASTTVFHTSTSHPAFPRVRGSHEDRFWAKVSPEPNSGCWLWCGDDNGKYGSFSYRISGRQHRHLAHRFSYRLHKGEIQDGLQLDHKCRTPICVNPDHLEPVTPAENYKRVPVGAKGGAKVKTHCKRGHALSGDNVRFDADGYAVCRECMRIHVRNSQARKRGRA